MWWDAKFNPEEHGDAYERLWWHFIEDDFYEWGTFWSHHIVPLTNRIVDDFQGDAQAKLHIRSDPGIHKAVEELVMSNYSVFYYLARSCAIVTSEPHLFLEDAFIFLRAAAENAGIFLGVFKSQVAPAFGIDGNQVPEWDNIRAGKLHEEIVDYRDALVHRGRLGRNPKLPWEFIPKHALGRSVWCIACRDAPYPWAAAPSMRGTRHTFGGSNRACGLRPPGRRRQQVCQSGRCHRSRRW